MTRTRKTQSPRKTSDRPRTAAKRSLRWGPRPLIYGEDQAAYDDLLVQVWKTVNPADVLEEIWVRDVVDLTWEIFRCRWIKTNLIDLQTRERLIELLKGLLNARDQEQDDADESAGDNRPQDSANGGNKQPSQPKNVVEAAMERLERRWAHVRYYKNQAEELLDGWTQQEPEAVQEFEELLASANVSLQDVQAQALSGEIMSDLERIDSMIAMIERRRNAMVREIDRHRLVVGELLRRATAQIEVDSGVSLLPDRSQS